MTRACGALTLVIAVVLVAPPLSAELLEEIQAPVKVPKFEFTGPGGAIEPGASGPYGFSLRNRYGAPMLNVTITAEIYRYATVGPDRAVNLSDPSDGSRFQPSESFGVPPAFASTGTLRASSFTASLAPNGTVEFAQTVGASKTSPEGVYFTRHRVEFDYANFTVPGNASTREAHFVMKSRGYFTEDEWATINYTDLEGSLAGLNISGIVPDSSFSVKVPASVWPLAALVAVTGVVGVLALAEYLVDTDPERYRGLRGALLQLSGKWHIARVTVEEALRARFARGPPAK